MKLSPVDFTVPLWSPEMIILEFPSKYSAVTGIPLKEKSSSLCIKKKGKIKTSKGTT